MRLQDQVEERSEGTQKKAFCQLPPGQDGTDMTMKNYMPHILNCAPTFERYSVFMNIYEYSVFTLCFWLLLAERKTLPVVE